MLGRRVDDNKRDHLLLCWNQRDDDDDDETPRKAASGRRRRRRRTLVERFLRRRPIELEWSVISKSTHSSALLEVDFDVREMV